MDNALKTLFITIFLFNSTVFADTLVLSTHLKVEYPSPAMIGHGDSYLLVKYKNWSFSHEHFNPKTFYQQIDLTGLEKIFVRSIYEKTQRDKLPEWLSVVSRQFSEGLKNNPDSIKKYKVGAAEIYSGHDNKEQGQIFIIEDLVIHHISVSGTKKELDLIAKNIKER